MWIDTHTHFDAPDFNDSRTQDWARAQALGVAAQVIPAVAPFNFATVREVAQAHAGSFYALGIHPMYVMGVVAQMSREQAMATLRAAIESSLSDERFVAIGEIGLDGFVPDLDWDTQVWFLREQLKLAREFDLPVLLHVRRAVDPVGKYVREFGIQKGIAHAFNGSDVQADVFVNMGLHLGFGGTLTYERSRQIRRLAARVPLSSVVIETDAPDIPPAWLAEGEANHSFELPRMAQVLAEVRGMSEVDLAQALWRNSLNALPRMRAVLGAALGAVFPEQSAVEA